MFRKLFIEGEHIGWAEVSDSPYFGVKFSIDSVHLKQIYAPTNTLPKLLDLRWTDEDPTFPKPPEESGFYRMEGDKINRMFLKDAGGRWSAHNVYGNKYDLEWRDVVELCGTRKLVKV